MDFSDHRTDNDLVVFLLKTVPSCYPLLFLIPTLVLANLYLISPIPLQNCTQITQVFLLL